MILRSNKSLNFPDILFSFRTSNAEEIYRKELQAALEESKNTSVEHYQEEENDIISIEDSDDEKIMKIITSKKSGLLVKLLFKKFNYFYSTKICSYTVQKLMQLLNLPGVSKSVGITCECINVQ